MPPASWGRRSIVFGVTVVVMVAPPRHPKNSAAAAYRGQLQLEFWNYYDPVAATAFGIIPLHHPKKNAAASASPKNEAGGGPRKHSFRWISDVQIQEMIDELPFFDDE